MDILYTFWFYTLYQICLFEYVFLPLLRGTIHVNHLFNETFMMLTYLCLYKSFKSVTPSKSPTSLVAIPQNWHPPPTLAQETLNSLRHEVSETELLLTVDHYWWSYDWLHDQTHYMALSLVNILSQQRRSQHIRQSLSQQESECLQFDNLCTDFKIRKFPERRQKPQLSGITNMLVSYLPHCL